MKKNNVLEFASRDAIPDPLTALLRSCAQQLINQAVETELQEMLSQYSDWRTDDGHSVVVRNGSNIYQVIYESLSRELVKVGRAHLQRHL